MVGADIADALLVQISDTDGTPLVASSAQVEVSNSATVAGTPAQPTFVEIAGPGTIAQSGNAATLDLGHFVIGAAGSTIDLAVANMTAAAGDWLSGTFDLAGDGAITVSGANVFQDLAGGGLQSGLTAALSTATVGTHTETITLAPSSGNASGESASLPAETLTITADVTLACYAAGTRILTPAGEVAVEDLRAGARVVTEGGRITPIRWIGHSRIGGGSARVPQTFWPVRVAAGAFGAGMPRRDLFLSPDHAVFLHGVLIPIHAGINGRTIARQCVGELSYYHVGLTGHDVLLAEGLPAESYLDTGNRAAFESGGDGDDYFSEQARCRANRCLRAAVAVSSSMAR